MLLTESFVDLFSLEIMSQLGEIKSDGAVVVLRGYPAEFRNFRKLSLDSSFGQSLGFFQETGASRLRKICETIPWFSHTRDSRKFCQTLAGAPIFEPSLETYETAFDPTHLEHEVMERFDPHILGLPFSALIINLAHLIESSPSRLFSETFLRSVENGSAMTEYVCRVSANGTQTEVQVPKLRNVLRSLETHAHPLLRQQLPHFLEKHQILKLLFIFDSAEDDQVKTLSKLKLDALLGPDDPCFGRVPGYLYPFN